MAKPNAERTFSGDFKRFFLRGLVVLLPSVLTLWIVVKAYQFVDNTIAEPINAWVRGALIQTSAAWPPLRDYFNPDDETVEREYLLQLETTARTPPRRERIKSELRAANVRAWWYERWYLNFIGLIVAIVAVYVAGRLLGGFFGKRLYKRLERMIQALPVFKQVYPHVKQVVDFLFSDDRQMKFNRVVVVQYPRKGIWSVGFLTGNTMKSIATEAGDSVTVFVPSSPTPFTGYTITVPRSETRELPISVEEAIRFAVTGGVLIPAHQAMPGGPSQLPLPPGDQNDHDEADPDPETGPGAETPEDPSPPENPGGPDEPGRPKSASAGSKTRRKRPRAAQPAGAGRSTESQSDAD